MKTTLIKLYQTTSKSFILHRPTQGLPIIPDFANLAIDASQPTTKVTQSFTGRWFVSDDSKSSLLLFYVQCISIYKDTEESF